MSNEEAWLTKKWRPITAIVYLVICAFDFMIFPVLWAIFSVKYGSGAVSAWDPLTLKGAGLFHLSFGAILGVSAFTRGQEKVSRYNTQQRYADPQISDEQPTRPKYAPPK